MALYYDLPVYKDVYRLIMMIFEYTKDSSRECKCTLAQEHKGDGECWCATAATCVAP